MDVVRDIPPGKEAPEVVNVYVEIPEGSRNKYEYDEKLKLIKLDRVLYSPFHYPGDYGFVPQTLWYDGDPLDVVILTRIPVAPGVIVETRPVGALEMIDNGEDDIKIIGVPAKDPYYDEITDIADVAPMMIAEIKHFFEVYKHLQGGITKINHVLHKAAAEKIILQAIENYKEKRKGKKLRILNPEIIIKGRIKKIE